MQKQIKIFLTLLTVITLAISCAGNNPNNPTAGTSLWKNNINYNLLIKDWYNPNYQTEIYKIEESGNNKIDFNVLNPQGDISYSISVSEIIWNNDNTSGIMYGIYTKIDESFQAGALNKWYAISFKNLTKSSLSISQAWVQDGTSSGIFYTETLEEAKTKFTEENKAFSVYSDLVPKTK